jgi:hypothetical protein
VDIKRLSQEVTMANDCGHLVMKRQARELFSCFLLPQRLPARIFARYKKP